MWWPGGGWDPSVSTDPRAADPTVGGTVLAGNLDVLVLLGTKGVPGRRRCPLHCPSSAETPPMDRGRPHVIDVYVFLCHCHYTSIQHSKPRSVKHGSLTALAAQPSPAVGHFSPPPPTPSTCSALRLLQPWEPQPCPLGGELSPQPSLSILLVGELMMGAWRGRAKSPKAGPSRHPSAHGPAQRRATPAGTHTPCNSQALSALLSLDPCGSSGGRKNKRFLYPFHR